MFKVLTCLATEHDFSLILVAAVVCFCGCFTAFRLFSRLQGAAGWVRGAWLLLTGLVAGCSIWATHFIAMLSFSTGLKAGFAAEGTLMSLLLAGLFMAAAFAVAALDTRLVYRAAGGALAGMGVGAMHFTGMTAYVTEGRIVWDGGLVAAAMAIGVGGGVGAMLSARQASDWRRQALSGFGLTLAICGLHFTAMGAVTIVPDASVHVPPQLLASQMLSLAVALIVGLIILGGLAAVLIEGGANAQALTRIRRLADAAYEGLAVVRDEVLIDVNAALTALVGAPAQTLIGRRLDDGVLIFEDGGAGDGARREARLIAADGAEIPVEVFGRLLESGGAEGDTHVLAVRDLRERREAEAQIRHLAEHDGLTGLPNRTAMQARLAHALERAAAGGERVAVICIDLDHFKEANDLHGHQAGDAVLVEAAQRLQAAIAPPSFAARLGGDEFVVVQVAAGAQPAAAASLLQTLQEALSRPAIHQGQAMTLGASLGVSLYPDDGTTVDELLVNADMALYRAKEGGRGVYRFFKREMDDSIRARRGVVRELRSAIEADELVLHYQPLARAADGSVCGYEALVRWNRPGHGLTSPADFIPIAEESGLIVPIGEWVLRTACAEAASWEQPLRIAVNLSPVQIQQTSLPTLVHQVLLETGLAPHRLELEVTESALFKDYQRALDVLRRLKALGVRIAMDDFGTGFSSLSTLQSFPFDKIKIDRSFVENIHRDPRATVIVRAVLGLGRSLDIPVTAEGVETAEQLAFLKAEACSEIQGYAVGRPGPVAEAGPVDVGGGEAVDAPRRAQR